MQRGMMPIFPVRVFCCRCLLSQPPALAACHLNQQTTHNPQQALEKRGYAICHTPLAMPNTWPRSLDDLVHAAARGENRPTRVPMHVALDQLESLWPPYRGAVLLGAARESQGRACNTGVAVTAGHVALSLDVYPASPGAATTRAAAGSTNTEGNRHAGDGVLSSANTETTSAGADTYASALAGPVGPSPPPLRLTVLLDAVPASAPTPGTHQMARFLTKVLARKAPLGADGAAAGSARKGKRLLGEDVPEMLVVEHLDEVR